MDQIRTSALWQRYPHAAENLEKLRFFNRLSRALWTGVLGGIGLMILSILVKNGWGFGTGVFIFFLAAIFGTQAEKKRELYDSAVSTTDAAVARLCRAVTVGTEKESNVVSFAGLPIDNIQLRSHEQMARLAGSIAGYQAQIREIKDSRMRQEWREMLVRSLASEEAELEFSLRALYEDMKLFTLNPRDPDELKRETEARWHASRV